MMMMTMAMTMTVIGRCVNWMMSFSSAEGRQYHSLACCYSFSLNRTAGSPFLQHSRRNISKNSSTDACLRLSQKSWGIYNVPEHFPLFYIFLQTLSKPETNTTKQSPFKQSLSIAHFATFSETVSK